MSNSTEAANLQDVYGRDTNGRGMDTSARIVVHALTDREIAEETLATLRQISDVITQIGANPSGMMARFMPGMGPVMDAVKQKRP